MSDGTCHTESITMPGGNFLMARVVGWGRNTFAGGKVPPQKGTHTLGLPGGCIFGRDHGPKQEQHTDVFLHAIFNGLKVEHQGKKAKALAPVPIWHSSQTSLLNPFVPLSALGLSHSKLFLYSVPAKYAAKYVLSPRKSIAATGTNKHIFFSLLDKNNSCHGSLT